MPVSYTPLSPEAYFFICCITYFFLHPPAGELLISQLAQETYDSLTDKSKSSPESYKKLFSVNPPYNLVLRITYVNKDNKKNIFIASGLADKDEGSVHFNGWLTEQREF